MIIDLAKPFELPSEYRQRLYGIEKICRTVQSSDELFEKGAVLNLAQDLGEFCYKNRVVGVHFTRAIRQEILDQGLLVRTGSEIRGRFLKQHSSKLTQNQVVLLQERWAAYFTSQQISSRDNSIFFNFTEEALEIGGAENLNGMYGGEQIHMCVELDEPLGKALANIGEPLVVYCALDPQHICGVYEEVLGRILVSSFHLHINPEIWREDTDAWQTVPVNPQDVLNIKALTSQ